MSVTQTRPEIADTDADSERAPEEQRPSGALKPVSEQAVSRRVLVIEDNVDAAEALAMFLDVIGHSVRVAHSGGEGVAIAREWSPEIVLSDIGLPGDMDGYEVARALRASAQPAYIVALSGYGQPQDKERARAAGFDAHLTKPVDANALERMLASVVPAPG